MSDSNNRDDPNDIFAEFDRLSYDLRKTPDPDLSLDSNTETDGGPEYSTPLQERRKTRKERLAEKHSGRPINKIIGKLTPMVQKIKNRKKSAKKRRKYRINVKKLILAIFCLGILCCFAAFAYVYTVVKDAPEIDPNNIYSLLAENSILYDSAGTEIDSIYNSPDGKRTNIAFADMPEDLYNAFVAIEDKTFWDHSGFNVIRMVGAIRDGLFSGGKISGTSTVTQQLARNIFLADTRTEYSLQRKILEAYYTILIEDKLTKQQIIEAYLNTIALGFNSSGVQAAAQSYFSKDVGELTLIECVALAALPQQPSVFSLVKRFNNESVAEEGEDVLVRGNTYTYVYNGDISKDRRNLVLRFMHEQGYIDEMRYESALNENLRDYINPYQGSASESYSYFADYVIEKVTEDLMTAFNYDIDQARRMLYNNGLRIYSTLDAGMQEIIEREFAENANYPKVANLKKDGAGNVLGQNKNILLYKYSNYFDEEGAFTIAPGEYDMLSNGNLKIFEGNRLNFFRTEVQGKVDYSVEFKNMYTEIDGVFYSIGGGFISIPREYKDRDEDGNLIVSSQFFVDKPDFFRFTENGLLLTNKNYTLRQQVIQPQSAMAITEFKSGHIKAMAGGRNTVGRLLFNRASSPRQPGSAIKPIGVYGPALQLSIDMLEGGSSLNFTAEGEDEAPAANLYGNFWTAASVIDDSPLMVGGRPWPKNWYNSYNGLFTMRAAVEQSVNVCSVKVLQAITPEYSHQFLKKLGVTSVVESGNVNDMNAAALGLGGMTKGISPLEMAGAYGAFPNQGEYVEPIAYTKVTNKYGETLLENKPITVQVMDPGVAFIMTDIMRSTVTAGIARQAGIGIQPVAGKTGTTTDNFDAWFVGLTPQYAAALWIGNDVSIELSQGSVSASRLWSKIMKKVCEGLPSGTFPGAPGNVISVSIDTKSGMLPSDLSSLDAREWTIRSEYFIKGTEPTNIDNVHTYVTVCRVSGYLATPYCFDVVSAFGVQRPYIPNPVVGDIKYEVPHHYCFIHNYDTETYPVNENALWSYNWEGMEITMETPETEDPDDPWEWPPPGEPGDLTDQDTNPDDEYFDFQLDEMPENLRP